jgi:lipopolysaccharide export LptBFGC system permease protein LptF
VILQLYILRQIVVAFVFAVGGMLFIALPGIAVAAVHRLAGVDTAAVLLFVPLLVLGLVPYILPLGFLLATVVTYGRLAADNEWTAIRMAGIHPLRMCLAPLGVAVACSAGTLWLISAKLPEVRRNEKQYQVDALQRTVLGLSPGRTELHLGRFYLHSGYREGNEFRNVVIHIPLPEGARTLYAESVSIEVEPEAEALLVRMRNARIVHGPVDATIESPLVRLDLARLVKRPEHGYRGLRYRTSAEIADLLAAGGEPGLEQEMRFEVHHRNALATTYLMFLLLGVPTGLLLRRGTQLAALAVAVGYALVYYVLSLRLGKELAAFGVLPPELAAWSVNALGALAGLWLLWRAMRQ